MIPTESDYISLPHLHSLTVYGAQRLLNAIEAQNIKNLNFHSSEKVDLNLTQSVPHLSQLSLWKTNLSYQMLSDNKSLYLPNLMILELGYMTVEGPLREYFKAPNLKRLRLHCVDVGPSDNGEGIRDHSSSTRLMSNLFSSQGFPDLESLSLYNTPLDESFSTDIKHISQLRCLKLDYEGVKGHILNFLRHIEDKEYLPSLVEVRISCEQLFYSPYRINYSWPPVPGLSYKDFVSQCAIKRPRMDIISDVQSEPDSFTPLQ